RSVRQNNATSAANAISASKPCTTVTGRTSPCIPLPRGVSARLPATSCKAASAAASHSAARPNSAIMRARSSGFGDRLLGLRRGHVLHLARHVFLVVLGEQVVGDERAVGCELALCDHARSLDEQRR